MTTDPLQYDATELYRLWDANGQLLYVGITTQIRSRMRQHRKEKPWWNEVANLTTERYATRKEAERHEQHAIRNEHPKYNIQGQPTFILPRKPSAIWKRDYIEKILNTPAPRTRRQHQAWIAFLQWYEDRINDEFANQIVHVDEWVRARQLIADKRQQIAQAQLHDN